MPTLEIDSPVSDEPFGYDVDDRETRLELELLDDLQKLGVKQYLDLPQASHTIIYLSEAISWLLAQLVVVGEQNAGKSSVLRAMTDIAFPVKSGLCTRFATEIVLRRGAPDFEVCIIPDEKEKPERKEMLKAWRPANFWSWGNPSKVCHGRLVRTGDLSTASKNLNADHNKPRLIKWSLETTQRETFQAAG